MIPYESLFALLGIETPRTLHSDNFNKETLRRFTEIYSPEVIQEGQYDALESLMFN